MNVRVNSRLNEGILQRVDGEMDVGVCSDEWTGKCYGNERVSSCAPQWVEC